MDDSQWRAPGREGPAGDRPEGGQHGPAAPPPMESPYAPPLGPSPYSTPPGTRPAQPHDTGAFATTQRHRDRVLGGAGYDSPAYRNDGVAVAAMVLGVVGVVVPGVCLLAIAFGHLARHRLRSSFEGGRGLAVAGLTLGYAMTVVWLGLLLLLLTARSLL